MGLYLPTGEKIKSASSPLDYDGARFIMRGAGVQSSDDCLISMTPLLEFQIQGFRIESGYFLYQPSKENDQVGILVEREVERVKYPIHKEVVKLSIYDSEHNGKYMRKIHFYDHLPLLLSTDQITVKPNIELSYFELHGIFQPVVHTIDVF